MNPSSFQFRPTDGRVEGTAFSFFFKLLATGIVAGCAGWMVRLWMAGALGSARTTGTGWLIAGLVMMAWTWWSILRSRTRIDASGIHQRWVWDKHMPLEDLAYVKLMRVRGLEWLIAPRIYARSLLGKFAVFYGADAALVREFERIEVELRRLRGF